MREIKFRFYNTLNHHMAYDIHDEYDGDRNCFSNYLDDEYGIVMQFIGLKDRKNKEIYEGDLIIFDCETYPEVAPIGTYRIEYATASFVGVNIEDDSIELHFGAWFRTTEEGKQALEVIGNIYESPIPTI